MAQIELAGLVVNSYSIDQLLALALYVTGNYDM